MAKTVTGFIVFVFLMTGFVPLVCSDDLLLAANRIDVLIEDRTVFEYFLYNSGVADEFDPAGVAGMEPVYIAFSPNLADAPRYADILTRGMKELRQSGALSDILKTYGLEDWSDARQ
jgi:polar amino acid transport system substrate-binding protein